MVRLAPQSVADHVAASSGPVSVSSAPSARIAAFFRDESCGQCVPCRVGTVRQEELITRLAKRQPVGSLAGELGLLRASDVIVFNSHELLYVAKNEARALFDSGYRPPLPARRVQVAGDVGIATFKMLLVNMLEGRFISPHDYEIATRIATVLCGGEIDRGSLVDEDWLLRLEREHFVALAQMPKTQERIAHMLKTGKPLRN